MPLTLEEIDERVKAIHLAFSEALHLNRIDKVSGKHNSLPEINLYLDPKDIPFEKIATYKSQQYVLCKVCKFNFYLCKHNPFMRGPARYEELAAEEKARQANVTDGTGSLKRGRQSSTVALTPEIIDECVRRFGTPGNTITALAKEFKVKAPDLSAALKTAGCKVVKGAAKGTIRPPAAPGTVRGKPRSTAIITPDILAECVEAFKAGRGMVAIAKEYNLSPNELSTALKAEGCMLLKGKRKS